jgi:uncharacterized membrane protein YoaT (DUF817 family)
MWNPSPISAVAYDSMGFRLPGPGKRLRFLASFVWLEAQACTFPFALVGLLVLTKAIDLPWLARYDWLFLLCIGVQLIMVATKLETWRDAAVVGVFHLLGIGLDLYKVKQGSWTYPEPAFFVVGQVPLYAGFMYGSVASFMALAWKKHALRAKDWPDWRLTLPIATLIYAQFFLPVWGVWSRIAMVALVCLVFRRCTVHFTAASERWWIPMPVAFVLIGSMIYVAENIATYFGAWSYPYQMQGWTPVDPNKLLSWILLMTVSLVVVAEYKRRTRLASFRAALIRFAESR